MQVENRDYAPYRIENTMPHNRRSSDEYHTKSRLFHSETPGSTELHLSNQVRHEIVEYLRQNRVSADGFCALTGWSKEYADEVFENQSWDLLFAIRLAEHLRIHLHVVVR